MQAVEIDNLLFFSVSRVVLASGRGEEVETFEFLELRREGDSNPYFLHQDQHMARFYGPCAETLTRHVPEESLRIRSATQHSFHPGEPAVVDSRFAEQTLVWGRNDRPFAQAPGPFAGTPDFLSVGSPGLGASRLFYNVSLVLTNPQRRQYYSARFPASRLPRGLVQAQLPSTLTENLNRLIWVAVIGLLAAGALTANPLPLRMFWWLGLLAWMVAQWGRSFPLYPVCHGLAGGFLLHFATHALDQAAPWVGLRPDVFESARAAAGLTLLLGLSVTAKKGYFVLSDGARAGGGCAWWIFLVGLLGYSALEETWYLSWFSDYAGRLPWSLLWLLPLFGYLRSTLRDYARVPLRGHGFRRLLGRLAGRLTTELGPIQAQAAQLAECADDLEDALRLSDDPEVLQFLHFAPDFVQLQEALLNLEKVDLSDLSEADARRIREDLQVLAEDLTQLMAAPTRLSATDTLKSLRVSPFLRTRE